MSLQSASALLQLEMKLTEPLCSCQSRHEDCLIQIQYWREVLQVLVQFVRAESPNLCQHLLSILRLRKQLRLHDGLHLQEVLQLLFGFQKPVSQHHFGLLQVTVLLDREQFQELLLLRHEVCERQHLRLHEFGGHQVHSWHEFVRARIRLAAKCLWLVRLACQHAFAQRE